MPPEDGVPQSLLLRLKPRTHRIAVCLIALSSRQSLHRRTVFQAPKAEIQEPRLLSTS